MAGFLPDLRHGARALFSRPGFAVAAIATLAIGIGAGTAIFSVVYGVLLRPLPFPRADRLVDVAEVTRTGKPMLVTDANFRDFRHDRRRARRGWVRRRHRAGPPHPSAFRGGSSSKRVR